MKRLGSAGSVSVAGSGTAALPGIAFASDPNTGIYNPGADQLAISTNGTSRLAVSTTAVSSTLAVDVPLGAAATPSITFTGDLNTGIYSPGADQVAISTGGTERMRMNSAGYIKASNNGTYASSTGSLHELKGNPDDNILRVENYQATLTGAIAGVRIVYSAASPNTTNCSFLYCDDSTNLRAEIRSNGGLANYSANNANLSDRNAKKDISLAADTWNCVKGWEIVNYRYNDQPDDADLNLGVIAQQVAESCPEVITVFQEAKEATETEPAKEERLGVKEQQMYWMAIKALQEAQIRIETLEARLTAAGIA